MLVPPNAYLPSPPSASSSGRQSIQLRTFLELGAMALSRVTPFASSVPMVVESTAQIMDCSAVPIKVSPHVHMILPSRTPLNPRSRMTLCG